MHRSKNAKPETVVLRAGLLALMLLFLLCTGCGRTDAVGKADTAKSGDTGENTWQVMLDAGADEILRPEYATQFCISRYGAYSLIEIADGQQILVVPEHTPVPEGLPADVTVMQQPLNHLYIAASSAMDFFVALEATSQVALTSTTYENWTLSEIQQALRDGVLEYVGKYSAPDYEYILDTGCDGVVESTMIYHSPDTMEQLRKLGLPVMVERSSYEAHPMGRLEWIRLYGVLTGKEAEADAFYADATKRFQQVIKEEASGKTVAFFYITSNGLANVRKPGDYLATMINLSGGKYIFDDLEVDSDSATSSMNMEMEAFYATARDADIIIYNSTIDGGVATLDQLLVKNPLLQDFKAVQQGNVWCTEKSMFQKTTATADMIEELHQIMTDATDSDQMRFLYRLR